jgi:hypothetical protein
MTEASWPLSWWLYTIALPLYGIINNNDNRKNGIINQRGDECCE